MAKSDVTVSITITKNIPSYGFGTPLILVSKASSAIAYREYFSLDDMKTDYAEETEVYKRAAVIWEQDGAPAKIAACSSTKKAAEALEEIYNQDWRQLVCVLAEAEDSTEAEVAAYMETKDDRLYFVTFESETALEGAITTKGDRTVAFVYGGDSLYPECALIGATAGKEAGSITYKNTILKGIEPEVLTDEQIDGIHDAGGLCFVTKAGDNVTSEGKVMSGEYIDIIDSKDWIISEIVYNTQKLLNTMPKVPYTNKGIAMLETQCVNVLKQAYENGMIADNDEGLPDYSTSYALRNEVSAADRIERKYLQGKFTFGLAGAIHQVHVDGEIIV